MTKKTISDQVEAMPMPGPQRRSAPPPPAPESSKASPAMAKLDGIDQNVRTVISLLEPSESDGPSTGEMILDSLEQIVESLRQLIEGQRQQRLLLESMRADIENLKRSARNGIVR